MSDTEVCWFSNGTEFSSWQSAWCSWCAHDHEMHEEQGGGCELVLLAMDHQPIPEWTDKSDTEGHTLPAAIYCSKFTPCEPCGPEPEWATKTRAPHVPDPCPVDGCRWQKRRGEDTCWAHREITPAELAMDRRAAQIVREMLIVGHGDQAADEITRLEQTLFDPAHNDGPGGAE